METQPKRMAITQGEKKLEIPKNIDADFFDENKTYKLLIPANENEFNVWLLKRNPEHDNATELAFIDRDGDITFISRDTDEWMDDLEFYEVTVDEPIEKTPKRKLSFGGKKRKKKRNSKRRKTKRKRLAI
jgi:hypothetical protein